MSTEQGQLDSIPLALIREAIEGLAIPDFEHITRIEITGTLVVVHRIGPVGPFGEMYAIDRRTVECPQCHQEIGRPHTEYCPLRIREEVFAGERDAVTTTDDIAQARLDDIAIDRAEQIAAAQDTAESLTDALNSATSFVDDGCRCASRDNHAPGCPALPHEYVEAAEVDNDNTGDLAPEPYCWTCGADRSDPRHADIDKAQAGPVPVDRPECGHANWPDCAVLHTP